MECLSDVLARVNVPCVAIVRDPRALFFSWAKRGEMSIDVWCRHHLSAAIQRYKSYGHGLIEALSKTPERILVVKYESLCVNPVIETERIMTSVGLDFDPAFVKFTSPQKNIHERNVSAKYISEYKDHFDIDVCRSIEFRLKEFKAWFWNGAD